MMALIQFNLVTLAAALAIGLATGWWIFARRAAPDRSNAEDIDPS